MERISREELYTSIAHLISLRGTCGRLQVGAVITHENRIISTGYNGPVAGGKHCNNKTCDTSSSCKRAIHAEANAIYFAANQGISLKGASIYCTHSPCIKCAEAIISSGIVEIFYIHSFRDTSGLDFIRENSNIKITQVLYEQR